LERQAITHYARMFRIMYWRCINIRRTPALPPWAKDYDTPPTNTEYQADVINAQVYYPFGIAMPVLFKNILII
jgi:hypothetical protein